MTQRTFRGLSRQKTLSVVQSERKIAEHAILEANIYQLIKKCDTILETGWLRQQPRKSYAVEHWGIGKTMKLEHKS